MSLHIKAFLNETIFFSSLSGSIVTLHTGNLQDGFGEDCGKAKERSYHLVQFGWSEKCFHRNRIQDSNILNFKVEGLTKEEEHDCTFVSLPLQPFAQMNASNKDNKFWTVASSHTFSGIDSPTQYKISTNFIFEVHTTERSFWNKNTRLRKCNFKCSYNNEQAD